MNNRGARILSSNVYQLTVSRQVTEGLITLATALQQQQPVSTCMHSSRFIYSRRFIGLTDAKPTQEQLVLITI